MRFISERDDLGRPVLQIVLNRADLLGYLEHLIGTLGGCTTGREAAEFDPSTYEAAGKTTRHIIAAISHGREAELITTDDLSGIMQTLRHAKWYLELHQQKAGEWFNRHSRQPKNKIDQLLNEDIPTPGYPGVGVIDWSGVIDA